MTGVQTCALPICREIDDARLRVNGKVRHLMQNKQDLGTRIKRNRLILIAAKNESREIELAYRESMEELAKIQEQGKIDVQNQNYKPSLKRSREYLAVGNWAHALLDAKRQSGPEWQEIMVEAENMRQHAIAKAKKRQASKNWQAELDYIDYISESKKIGRETKDLDFAIQKLSNEIGVVA